eukprot:1546648-Pyramimonas_sp.AAC.1
MCWALLGHVLVISWSLLGHALAIWLTQQSQRLRLAHKNKPQKAGSCLTAKVAASIPQHGDIMLSFFKPSPSNDFPIS